MNLNEIDFLCIVKEMQKIKWPFKAKTSGFYDLLDNIQQSDTKVPSVQILVGSFLSEFITEALIKVYGWEETSSILDKGDDINIKMVLEEAHPELLIGILYKIKSKILEEVTIEKWNEYGGY